MLRLSSKFRDPAGARPPSGSEVKRESLLNLIYSYSRNHKKCLTGLWRTTSLHRRVFLCWQWRACTHIDEHKKTTEAKCFGYRSVFRDPGGMVGFCARRAQKALFQTHSALTDAVFYTKIWGSNSPDFFGNFAADFGHAFDKDSKIVLKKPMNLKWFQNQKTLLQMCFL